MFGKTNWVLKGVRGAHAHAIYVLETNVILGRSSEADIQILDQRVSRQHARLLVGPDELVLEDLESHNGTFVHGLRINRRPIRPGDRVRIGVSEYVIDQIKGRVLTSAIFLNKLTNKDTMGATAVTKRVTREILTAQTAEMPAVRATQEITAHVQESAPEPQRAPLRTEPAPEPPLEAEPAYLREQRERAVRLPTPMPGELSWRPEGVSAPAEPPQSPEPAPSALLPDAGLPLRQEPRANPFSEALDIETVPLDPRTQRVPTPVPQSQPPVAPPPSYSGQPEPAARPAAPEPPPSEDQGLEAALRTVDAVVRLLKLRAQESGGALLKIQDRENLRRLEGVLRESRRNRSNRRRWSRLPCQLSAQVGDLGDDARVTDIGAGGLRVSGGNLMLAPGDVVTVRVHLGEGPLARIAVFQTKIAWVDDSNDTFGAIFAGPAHWELAS